MRNAQTLVEIHRGPFAESVHRGHAVICDAAGQVRASWGDPEKVILPRSSVKMIQALPLIESGAADAAGLTPRHLALACASHAGDPVHTGMVADWLHGLSLGEGDLRCGAHYPFSTDSRNALIRAQEAPCQYHNTCSGKHAGFLTWVRHMNAGPEYVEPDHPLQTTIRATFEELTGAVSPGFGIDGCSAPSYAASLHGIAHAMARFAVAREDGDARERAMVRLHQAMRAHPEMVGGEGRACTELIRASGGRVAVKFGAEGIYIAILPEQGLGVALKMEDGAGRGSEAAIAAILVELGALDAADPLVAKRLAPVERNWRGLETGFTRTVGFKGVL